MIWMTEDEAQTLSNRLQAMAKGQGPYSVETIISKGPHHGT
jgi:hypothetical protein